MRDYERASVWCDQVRRSSERWSDQITFAICRAHYADILLWRGAWADCEAELDSAAREYRAINERRVTDAVARLGELRRRQGRRQEAGASSATRSRTRCRPWGGRPSPWRPATRPPPWS